jgi:hypothetical protein
MRATLVTLLVAVLVLLPVSYGQVASSSSISQDALTRPNTSAQPVSSVEQIDDSIADMPQLRATGFFTVHMPIVMNGYCTPFTIADPYFSPYQFDMRQINADDAWLRCVQGSPNVVVAIIDTGVNLSHLDLAPNLIPGASFVANEPSAEDGEGHGSNVAGIVGAALNGIGVVGVAPMTRLLPVKV